MTIGASAGVITFINTRDPEKARAFYGETLGFRFVVDDGFAHVFDLNGTTLRITKIDNHVAQGHPVLGWMVDDIEGTIRRLVAHGRKANLRLVVLLRQPSRKKIRRKP